MRRHYDKEKKWEKQSLVSFRSNLSENEERKIKKWEKDRQRSQEHHSSILNSRTSSMRNLHQEIEHKLIKDSLNSYETRIKDHRELLMNNKNKI